MARYLTRKTRDGETVCGHTYDTGLKKHRIQTPVIRACVREPGHAGWHRSYETLDHHRYFWNNDGEETLRLTEDEWTNQLIANAVKELSELLQNYG